MIDHLSLGCICLPWVNPSINLWARWCVSPCVSSSLVLCSGVDYGIVRVILNGAISSPAEVDLPALDEAIRWVEDRGTVRRLDKGADRDMYSQQFDAAAVEMRVLRQQLTAGSSLARRRLPNAC